MYYIILSSYIFYITWFKNYSKLAIPAKFILPRRKKIFDFNNSIFLIMNYFNDFSICWTFQLSILWDMTLFVSSSGTHTYNLDGIPTCEHAKYNWTNEKHWFSRFISQTLKIWPCDLLKVMANASRIENLSLTNPESISFGIFRSSEKKFLHLRIFL